MRKCVLYSIVLCAALLVGCNREPADKPDNPENPIELMNGAIIIDNNPNVAIAMKNEFPEGSETRSSIFPQRIKSSAGDEQPPVQLKANDYRFKLVAQMGTLNLERNGKEYAAQASHVKILDNGNNGYAFVSYNHQHEPNIGGLVVYKYTITGEQSLEKVSVTVVPVSSIKMPNAQINAIDFDGQKLYIAGATDRPSALGFKGRDPAFFMVMELDADKKFKPDEPNAVRQLTSFQSTSIRCYDGRIYITTGDGTNGTKGGLYIFDATDYSEISSILNLQDARSVDADESGVYLMQSNDARVSKISGGSATEIYNESGRATQLYAKSEILAWGDYIFVSENESGLTMLSKDGQIYRRLAPPNRDKEDCVGRKVDFECWYCEEDVTNSVSMNSDGKKAFDGEGAPYEVNSNLLLLANGRQGLYWYDIAKDADGNDWIVASSVNNILKGLGSCNFVKSKGNIVFVADGLGGLKVLYIGFNAGNEPPGLVTGDGCTDFMPFLFEGSDNLTPLFPEEKSVFRADAHDIVKTLFQSPDAIDKTINYIKITKNNTPLYITYMSEGAGWNNTLGYFVIPAGVAENEQAEYQYYINDIRPNLTTVTGGVNVLKDEYIIFKYIRDVNPIHGGTGGHMVQGNTYQIGGLGKTFQKGDRIVLFMCPDGFNSQNNRVEVTFDPGANGNVRQIFFMHKYLNIQTEIKYANGYGDFAGIQFMSFYSASCESTILCIEDIHTQHQYLDLDFNDIIFTVSDNLEHKPVKGYDPPQWAVGERENNPGILEILPTEDLLGK